MRAFVEVRVTRSQFSYWTAWLGVAGVGAIAAVIVPAAAPSADTTPCPAKSTSANPPHPDPKYVNFDQPPPGTTVRLQFDDSKGPRKGRFPFTLVRGITAPSGTGLNTDLGLNARFGVLGGLRGPADNWIYPAGTGVELGLERWSDNTIAVCVRLNKADIGVPPGSYSGTIGIAYRDQLKTSVPVVATFRERWQQAALIAFLGAFFGLVVKVLSEAAALARSKAISGRRALREYITQLTFVVTVILAAISANFTYVVLYTHDRDWGADPNDGLRLFATCFIVQMGSSEALAVVSRFAGGLPGPRIPGPS
jgi:hypothetical protein